MQSAAVTLGSYSSNKSLARNSQLAVVQTLCGSERSIWRMWAACMEVCPETVLVTEPTARLYMQAAVLHRVELPEFEASSLHIRTTNF